VRESDIAASARTPLHTIMTTLYLSPSLNRRCASLKSVVLRVSILSTAEPVSRPSLCVGGGAVMRNRGVFDTEERIGEACD
jgi:hypothetical protein